MARRRRRHTDERDISNRSLTPPPLPVARLDPLILAARLNIERASLQRLHRHILASEYEDRRRHHPQRQHAPLATIGPRSARALVQAPTHLRFANPNRVMVCVRRQQRKEVLHALRRLGKGGSKRRYTRHSQISCRG